MPLRRTPSNWRFRMMVVLFSITMREGASVEDEEAASQEMWKIVSAMPGFISYKAYTAADGETIAVVRFESSEALDAWRSQPDHRAAQQRARDEWYSEYWIQACEVVRSRRFTMDGGYGPIPLEVFKRGAREPVASGVAVE
jgi:heme-degrading monooxygenase HmoA